MSLWKKLFGENKPQPAVVPAEPAPVPTPEIKESDFIDTSDPNSTEQPQPAVKTIFIGTGMPIDLIYSYIEQDWEHQGYLDAQSNPDLKYMTTKVEMLKNNLVHRFELTTMNYDIKKADLMNQMETANQLGLLTSINLINSRLAIIKQHVEKIDLMAQQLAQEEPSMMVMMETYKRGFANGVAEHIKMIAEG